MKKIIKGIKFLIGFPYYTYKMYNYVKNISQDFKQVERLFSLYHNLDLDYLPPTRGWAGAPDFLSEISECIIRKKPHFIFEVSSGASTVVIGKSLLYNKKGHSLSIDHEKYYSDITKHNTKRNNLDKISQVHHVPLIKYDLDGKSWLWYDLTNIEIRDKIDILVIDGPPAFIQPLSRYPALPLLYDKLSKNASILLDDSNCADEKVIVEKWKLFLIEKKRDFICVDHSGFETGMISIELDPKE